MLHDPRTVIGSDFDQETAEKIAPQFIPRLELANCTFFESWKIEKRQRFAISRDMGKCLPQNMYSCTLVLTAEKKESKTSD